MFYHVNSYLTGLNSIFYVSFAVNQTSFTMTNSMSLSTHLSWHSLHTTSPQYVVKVCIFNFVFDVFNYKDMTLIQPKIIKCSVFFHPNNFFPFSLVPRNQLLSVAAACKVLIEFSLLRLENPDEACAVSQVRETVLEKTEHLDIPMTGNMLSFPF